MRYWMREFLRELRCAIIGHPGLWVADINLTRLTSHTNPPIGGPNVRFNGREVPWRCAWCRRTLYDIGKDYATVPDWLKELGW